MIVVSDTSPLNYLLLVGVADVLPAMFNRVVAPPAVLAEMQHAAAPQIVRAWAASPPTWLEVIAPSHLDETLNLGHGEREAICLAQQLHADVVLIDECKALAVARRLGIPAAGTVAVLELAAQKQLIDLPAVVAQLRQTNFRCPADILDAMLRRDQQRRV